jgi:hypothetical protein
MGSKFEYKWFETCVEWVGDNEDPDEWDNFDDQEWVPEDSIRAVLNELGKEPWDSIDVRTDEVICYPADSHQDFRTGVHTSNQLIIRVKYPRWVDRLMSCHYNHKH